MNKEIIKKILCVDDIKGVAETFKDALEEYVPVLKADPDNNFHENIYKLEILPFTNSVKADARLKQGDIDILLADISMPDLCGLSLLRRLYDYQRNHISNFTQPILITGYNGTGNQGKVELVDTLPRGTTEIEEGLQNFVKERDLTLEKYTFSRYYGCLEYITKTGNDEMFKSAELAISNAILAQEEKLAGRDEAVNQARAFIEMVNNKDAYTGKHSRDVGFYSIALVKKIYKTPELREKYGITEIMVKRTVPYASILHDIGKILTDIELLNAGTFTDDQRELMKKHVGENVDKILVMRSLKKLAGIIKGHHENLDGSGYPLNLLGDQIPIESQIIAIGDRFGAMDDDRPYRRAYTREKTLGILWEEANGGKLNKDFVDVFINGRVYEQLDKKE